MSESVSMIESLNRLIINNYMKSQNKRPIFVYIPYSNHIKVELFSYLQQVLRIFRVTSELHTKLALRLAVIWW